MNGRYARLDKRSRRILEAHRNDCLRRGNAEAVTFAMIKKGRRFKHAALFSISDRPDRIACRFSPLPSDPYFISYFA
jgi:hypothetical protein